MEVTVKKIKVGTDSNGMIFVERMKEYIGRKISVSPRGGSSNFFDGAGWGWDKSWLIFAKGGKKMKEKKKVYPKGKKVYVQFNCPDNDDDFMMKGSFDPKKLNENHPFAECTIGDLKHIVITKSVKKVK